MFDLKKIKEESGLSAIELARLEEGVRREFESDEMMFELHLLRALRAIREGWVTLEEALSEGVKA